jgi:hypothetical protein
VAATRAIRRLHLVGVAVADDNKDDGLKVRRRRYAAQTALAGRRPAGFRRALAAGERPR